MSKENSTIDIDVLEAMKKEDSDILATLQDDKATKRFILNCFCELLSEMKKLAGETNALFETLTVIASDKIASFFTEVKVNTKKEEDRLKAQEIASRSHKKKKKILA